MLSPNEIEETRHVIHLDISVRTASGACKVTHVCRTIPMRVWVVEAGGFVLQGAGKHLVCTASGLLRIEHLRVGDLLITVDGMRAVSVVRETTETARLYDIRVDSDDHTYFSNGILSHNSTGLGSSEWLKQNILPNYSWLYLAPLQQHVKTFVDKLEALQRVGPFNKTWLAGKKLRSNLNFKETPGGGTFKALHVLRDPTKIRGNTARSVAVDEAQNFDAEFLPEIQQVQKAFGATRYTSFTGTALTLDTCLQAKFDESSQGVWHVRCSCPKKWHPMDDKEAIFKMMSVHGLKCPDSGQLLDPLNGRFVHQMDDAFKMKRVGFHVPQVIVPEYARGYEWLNIWEDFKNYAPEKFLREIMGIATEEGHSEITEADLRNCCGDHSFEEIQKQLKSGKRSYRYLFAGCDWGGSDWNPAENSKLSYTVGSIYGLNPNGVLELVHAQRYANEDYKVIAGHIASKFREYNCYAMGTDFGGGQYYNAHMRDLGGIDPNRIISFNYGEPADVLKRIPHPTWLLMSLHRTDSISAVFDDIKSRKFLFPKWEESKGFLRDFMNCRRNFTEVPRSGRTIMRFMKHGAKSDDFLMSTNYAAMMKRITTNESTIPNSQVMLEINRIVGNSGARGNGFGGINLGPGFSM